MCEQNSNAALLTLPIENIRSLELVDIELKKLGQRLTAPNKALLDENLNIDNAAKVQGDLVAHSGVKVGFVNE